MNHQMLVHFIIFYLVDLVGYYLIHFNWYFYSFTFFQHYRYYHQVIDFKQCLMLYFFYIFESHCFFLILFFIPFFMISSTLLVTILHCFYFQKPIIFPIKLTEKYSFLLFVMNSIVFFFIFISVILIDMLYSILPHLSHQNHHFNNQY